MNLRSKILGLALVVGTAAATLPGAAHGTPIEDKQRQARALEAQIASTGERINALNERVNGARYRLAQAQAGIAEAERRTREAEAEMARIQKLLAGRAARIYISAGSQTPLDAIDVGSVNELGTRSKYASAAAAADDALLERLQRAKEDLAVQRAQLEQQRAAAAAEQAAADQARRQAQAALAQQRRLLSQVQGELAALVRAEQERRAREDAERARRIIDAPRPPGAAPSPRRPGAPPNFPNVPAPNPRAAAAVAYAKAQVGKCYRFGASGPDCFDCSGLTKMAWAQAGVYLSHFSGAQWREVVHIGAGDLQPGDLIFYGPGGSRHVEIYIGGGMVVSASNPASGVKLTGARIGQASGFGRPGA